MLLVKNLLTQWETEEENRTRDQSMKNLPTNEGDEEENRKIIRCRYCQWKNLPIWTKDKEGKTENSGEKRNVVWSMRNLDDKGLGQNKVLYNSSGIELPMVKLPLQAPRHFLHQGDRSLATCRLLALGTALTRIPPCHLFLVAFSLSLHLARFLAHLVGRLQFRFRGSVAWLWV